MASKLVGTLTTEKAVHGSTTFGQPEYSATMVTSFAHSSSLSSLAPS